MPNKYPNNYQTNVQLTLAILPTYSLAYHGLRPAEFGHYLYPLAMMIASWALLPGEVALSKGLII